MKKKTILTVLLILFVPAIVFALFGFTLWDFNPGNWMETERGIMASFVLIFTSLAVILINTSKS